MTLTEQERTLFATLRRFVAAQGLPTTLRVAGGWVRDKLLGEPMARVDIDLAVDAPSGTAFAEHLREWLRGEGEDTAGGDRGPRVGVIRRCPARAKHLETARLSVLGLTLDVVSLRTEAYAAGSRIPAVAGGTPREDAFRRDLTINALFYNITERTVEDWTGRGVADLRRRLVRTPLAARTTLLDDPLRALRAVRFAARLRFGVDAALAAAASDAGVRQAFATKISRERVAAELDAILTAPSAVRGVGLLAQLGLLPLVLPSVVPAAEALGGGQLAGEAGAGAELGSPAVTSAPAVAAAIAATGALASLEALRLADFGGWAAAGAALAAEEVRLARYAALTLLLARRATALAAGRDTTVGTRTATRPARRPRSAVAATLREELRMASRDVAAVVCVHEAAATFRALVTSDRPPATLFRPADRLGAAVDPQPPARAAPRLPSADVAERLALGLATRAAGPHWRVSLLIAAVGDLPPGDAAPNVLDADYTPAAALAAGAATNRLVGAYGRLARRIRDANVAAAADVRPLLDGTAVAAVLPHLRRGPLVGEILDQQVRWRLAHPTLSADTCAEWILAEYGHAHGQGGGAEADG